jgi:hypothetical protein
VLLMMTCPALRAAVIERCFFEPENSQRPYSSSSSSTDRTVGRSFLPDLQSARQPGIMDNLLVPGVDAAVRDEPSW